MTAYGFGLNRGRGGASRCGCSVGRRERIAEFGSLLTPPRRGGPCPDCLPCPPRQARPPTSAGKADVRPALASAGAMVASPGAAAYAVFSLTLHRTGATRYILRRIHGGRMRSRSGKTPVQGSLFEEDYLLRTLGPVVQSPDIALTELVANSCDDGCGMTLKQFKQRWMTLGYDRTRHQGTMAEFPRELAESRRPAFGRNGVGRHGLLCFASEYEVEMRR